MKKNKGKDLHRTYIVSTCHIAKPGLNQGFSKKNKSIIQQ